MGQTGGKHLAAKPITGIIKGAGVLEIIDDHDTNTFRAVYTVRFPGAVYVLHVFQKKAKPGIGTPRHEIDLIRSRYEQARRDHLSEFGEPKAKGRK